MVQPFHGNLFMDAAKFIEVACVPFLIEKVVKTMAMYYNNYHTRG